MTRNGTKNRPYADVIRQYSRAQAIEEGFRIDVTETATEAGVVFPTALTVAVRQSCVKRPEEVPWRNERERLWEVLTMLNHAIRRKGVGVWQIPFNVVLHNHAGQLRRTELVAICGPGDDGEPAITVRVPDED